jgi:dolichol-phosphate mannosyltransferase
VKLSIVVPAHNEEGSIGGTVERLFQTLTAADISHEILVVNDHSTDGTLTVLETIAPRTPTLSWVNNTKAAGFGYTVRTGLEHFAGDAVCVVMADASDDPRDIVKYFRRLEEGYECVFGSRFMRESVVVDYPRHKLVLNRLANSFIKALFGFRYNDTTNAFKCYRREVIEGLEPILSYHFNITVELPLKAIIRGYTYSVVPVNWYNRTTGVSKLKIKEMGSRYLFIVLYVFLEKLLSRGDYRRSAEGDPPIVTDAAERSTKLLR